MSLVVRATINDGPNIAIIAAQRLQGGTDPDSIGMYVVNAWHVPLESQERDEHGVPTGIGGFTQLVTDQAVEHRYGDGALALVVKMAEVVKECLP